MVYLTHRKTRGFTLIEVVASLAILTILLASVFVLYERTSSRVIAQTIEERALAVAQRQMEILIATRQEPESHEASGWDAFDPMFQWHIALKRESMGETPPKPDLTNTVIKAVVTVEWDERSNLGYDYDYDDGYGYEDDDFNQEDNSDWFADDWDDEFSDDYYDDDYYDEYYKDRNRKSQTRLQEVATKIELVRYFEHRGFKPIAGQLIAVPLVREIPSNPEWYTDLVEELGREPTPEEVIQKMFNMAGISPDIIGEMGLSTDEVLESD